MEQISTSPSSSSDEEIDGYISEPSYLARVEEIHVNRTGGSLSLSENEFDSDEFDIPLTLKHPRTKNMNLHTKHSSLQKISIPPKSS